MYRGRRVFKLGAGAVLGFVALTMLFVTGAAFTYRERGWTWVSAGLAAASVILGLGSVIESLVTRIELTDDAMIVTGLSGRRRYAVTEIQGIEEARGVPPVIRLRDGRRVKLPSVGSSLGNSVRAWLSG